MWEVVLGEKKPRQATFSDLFLTAPLGYRLMLFAGKKRSYLLKAPRRLLPGEVLLIYIVNGTQDLSGRSPWRVEARPCHFLGMFHSLNAPAVQGTPSTLL